MLYDQVVRSRSGLPELRAAFARDLLVAGELERAREQINAALLLDSTCPRIRALEAWSILAGGDADSAAVLTARLIEEAPWCDLALLVKARAEHGLGDSDRAARTLLHWKERVRAHATPDYVFRPRWGRYDLVHTYPAIERRIVPESLRSGPNAKVRNPG
jgi:hypothetical protein